MRGGRLPSPLIVRAMSCSKAKSSQTMSYQALVPRVLGVVALMLGKLSQARL